MSAIRQSSKQGANMTWTKPEFATLHLDSEVTSYRYTR
jgi:hypothetical protein